MSRCTEQEKEASTTSILKMKKNSQNLLLELVVWKRLIFYVPAT